MNRILLTALLLALPVSASAQAMPGMAHPTSNGSAVLQGLSGPAFDRAFLSMMTPHHQAAVAMSRALLARSHDAGVRRWAQGIIAAQEREIAEMTALLRPLGGPQPQMAAAMTDMAAGVRAARDPDQTYVEGMVSHHAGALDMATVALQRSGNPRVLRLARDIARSQAQEIYDFRLWLLRH